MKLEKGKKKRKNAATSFGWEVFNQDARYRSYKKQLGTLPGVCVRLRTLACGSVGFCAPQFVDVVCVCV